MKRAIATFGFCTAALVGMGLQGQGVESDSGVLEVGDLKAYFPAIRPETMSSPACSAEITALAFADVELSEKMEAYQAAYDAAMECVMGGQQNTTEPNPIPAQYSVLQR